MSWNTIERARGAWVNSLTDERLQDLLDVANAQCIAYLGEDPSVVTEARLFEAELMQARNIYNAGKADPAEAADGTQFIIRPYPMDSHVRNLLLPKQAMPGFF